MTAATATTVQYLNLAYFGRPADPASLTAFPATGMTDEQIVEVFVKTTEYSTNTLTPSTVGSSISRTKLINIFYNRLFGRDAVSSEVDGWTNAIATGAVNEEYLGITIMRAGLNLPVDTDIRKVLVAKFDSADAFTTNLSNNPSSAAAYTTQSAGDSAASFLTGITTATAAPTTHVENAVAAMVLASTPGTTYSLTSSLDSITGTDLNDTIYGVASGTLEGGDIIDGGKGTDTLVATMGAASKSLRPIVSNVESLKFELSDPTGAGAATHTFNFDRASGVDTVEFANYTFDTAADTVVAKNVTSDVAFTISDDAGHASARANNYELQFSDVTGTADSYSVDVSMSTADGAIGGITIAGVESVTVNSTGGFDASYGLTAAAATTVSLTAVADDTATDTGAGTATVVATSATTLNVTSSNDLTVSDGASGLVKVGTFNVVSNDADSTITITDFVTTNAATATETVTFNVSGAGDASLKANTAFTANNTGVAEDKVVVSGSASTGDISYETNTSVANLVTTGSGNDTVTLAGILDADDSIALGAGSSDKIVATASYSSNAADDLFYDDDDSDTSDDPSISGVEIAAVTLGANGGTAATTDVSSAGFAGTLELLGDIGAISNTVTGIKAGQTIKLGKTLDLTDASSVLVLTGADATSAAPSDSFTITSDLLTSGTATLADIEDIKADTVKAIDLTLTSTDTAVTDVKLSDLQAEKATSIKISSAEKVTIEDIDAANGAVIDLTGVTGESSITVDTALDYTVKGAGAAKTTFVMGTGLDADDVITGGSATSDVLTATVNGLTATTGKLAVTGVENIDLLTSTAASTIDASGISGATIIRLFGDGTHGGDGSKNVTLTNLASGTFLGLGSNVEGTNDSYKATVAVSLADSSGSSDSLTVELGNRSANSDITGTLTGSGIETLNIVDAQNADQDATLNINGFAATTVKATGGKAGEALDLSGAILNAATTTFDGSAYDGVLTVSANTNTATSITSKGVVGTITGGALSDTITIGTASNFIDAAIGTVVGGVGADTLNLYVGGTNVDLDAVTAVETINFTIDSVNSFSFTAANSADGTIVAETVTYSGGKAGQTYTSAGTLTDLTGGRTINAGQLLGSVALTFGDDTLVQSNLSDAITITGGQGSTDLVTASISGTNTGTFTMSGVETLNAGVDTTASTIDLTNVTGLTNLVLTNDGGTGAQVTVSNLTSSTALTLGDSSNEFDAQKVVATLKDATGSADSLTVNLVDTNAGSGTATIDADGVETLTLALADSTEVHKVDLDNNLTSGAKLVVTGANTAADLTIAGLEAAYTTIDASGSKGFLNLASGVRGSSAMTITAGENADDHIAMENINDVLDGGDGASDMLEVVFSGVGGAITVDLSSSSDQVTFFNGLAEANVQKGFEDVDLSAYSAGGGAQITGTTGANTIVGTAYADIIDASSGADSVTGGAGGDTITIAGTTDISTINIAAGDTVLTIGGAGTSGTITGFDTITGFAAGDGTNKSDVLNVGGTGAKATATAATNGTDSTLKVDVSGTGTVIKSHSIASTGVITFTENDTFGSGTAMVLATEGDIAAAIQYLQANDIGDAGMSVIIDVGTDNYIFTQGDADGTNEYDQLVKLVGVQADTFITTNATGSNDLMIA